MSKEEKTDRLVGAVLDGRFRLDRLLGAGGMGKVYAGHQLSVDRLVAVKVLREELSESDSLAQRFFREAKVVASLRHANVVGLVEFGRDPERGLLYIAMEYIDGTSLAQLLGGGRIEATLAVAIARQICSALAEAHAAGVIHRDLKPDNVMLVTTAEGALSVKVLDFGIALPTGEEARLTSTGAIVGTPHYMAPEQSQDREVTPQADLYALGVLLYEMLSGSLPFVADTPMAVLLKAITQPPPTLDEVLGEDELPPSSLRALVSALMAKDPADRPPTVADVGRRLDEIARLEQLPALTITSDTSLASLVIARDSDEFVLGATLASPAPGTPERQAKVPVQTTADLSDGIGNPRVPERRKLGKRWLLAPLPLLFCTVCCFSSVRDCIAKNQENKGVVAVPALTGKDTGDAGAGGDAATSATDAAAATQSDVGSNEPVDSASAPEAQAPRPARQQARQPSRTPPTPSTTLHQAQMAAGGICQLPRCDFLGTARPGAAVCQGESDCTAKCPISGCPQTCSAQASCEFSCAGGSCLQTCSGQARCRLSCDGGSCVQNCLGESNCEMSCDGGNCAQACIGEGSCKKSCRPGNC